MASSQVSFRDWSSLPDDVLGSFLERLALDDHVRFGAVCASARKPPGVPGGGATSRAPSLWLLMSRNRYDRGSSAGANTRDFISVPDGRNYRIPLPSSRFRHCIGSSGGWLVVAKDKDELCLLNPPSGVVHGLPRLPHGRCFSKAALFLGASPLLPSSSSSSSRSSSPSMGSYAMAMIGRFMKGMAVAKAGDASWTLLETPFRRLTDVSIHNGQAYALNDDGRAVVCDLAGGQACAVAQGFEPGTVFWQDAGEMDHVYLVAPPPGRKNMWLAMRRSWNPKFSDDSCRYVTKGLEVFELDAVGGRRRKVQSLRGLALFLGDKFSSFCVEGWTEFRGNRAYLSDEGPKHGVGAFDMEGGRLELCP